MKIIFLFYIIFLSSFLSAQKQDYIWLWGFEPYDINIPERAVDTTKGASNIDFNFEPPLIYYDPNRFLDFSGVNSSICNSNSEILAYTNGQVIYNQFDEPIADTINYSKDWEYSNGGDSDMAIPIGILGVQAALIIPVPEVPYAYYALYTTRDRENPPYVKHKISYAIFEVDDQNKDGKLINKDIVMLEDSLSGSITAVKHGNGRDWWLIAPRSIGNTLNIWLIDTQGIHFSGMYKTPFNSDHGIGQIYSSPDGNWLSWFNAISFTEKGGQLFLAQFDRCSGTLYDPDFIYVDLVDRFGFGVSFSYDSRYLYMSNRDFIYQYDLYENDVLDTELKVATYDGYEYFFSWDTIQPLGRDVNFFNLGLAPDGRIYISPSSAYTRMMSVMHFPHRESKECDVRQHTLLMPTGFHRGIPNFPTYRLGSEDGSVCDTLSLDNHPVAKFRYEVDTLDYLNLYFTDLSYFRPESWSWNFGDGSPVVSERYPYHSFPVNGAYNVCLTVSNENSTNVICDSIHIATSSTQNVGKNNIVDVSLYPNPVVDFVQATFGGYIPQKGILNIVDLSGKIVLTQRFYYGQNIVDMTSLSSGVYICVFKDGFHVLKSMKIMKM